MLIEVRLSGVTLGLGWALRRTHKGDDEARGQQTSSSSTHTNQNQCSINELEALAMERAEPKNLDSRDPNKP